MQLEGLLTWEADYDGSNVIQILNMVKIISHHLTSHMYPPLSLYIAKRSVYRLRQGLHMNNTQLVKTLKARVEVVEEIARVIRTDSKLVEYKFAKYLKDIIVEPADATPVHTIKEKGAPKSNTLR